MSKQKKGGFQDLLYKTIMPKVYGIGAAVVIVGALFKINHYPGASAMLGIGLGVEAVIFFLSAFEPPHKDPDWAKVYPELSEDYSGPINSPRISSGGKGDNVAQKLDHMLESAKIGPDLIESLGKGMNNLATNAKGMASLSNAAVATEDYSKNVKAASKSLVDMSSSYAQTAQAMSSMADASGDAKQYHEEVRGITKKLGALNSVYELELQSTDSHVKTMSKFYGNMAGVMENMEKAGKGTEKFSQEMQKLTGNLTSLNGIYGSMLTAMKGSN
ncbi:MAG: gliding motility protein GldL [Cyclobacteriaceae bacterium]|nr:gliding motility protein GldL [Cyclobacteriaceae bacterium]